MDLNHVKCMPHVWNNPHITINTMWMIQFGSWTPNKATWPIWRCHVACSHWSKTAKSTCHLCTQSTILCHMSDHYFSTSILRSFPHHSTWNSLDGATLHAMVVPHGMPWWFHVALFYWSIWQSKNAKNKWHMWHSRVATSLYLHNANLSSINCWCHRLTATFAWFDLNFDWA